MRTTTFKFYDTSSLLVIGSELFDNRFAISSITLEELESIKVSANKDSDIKYAARQLLNQLYHNTDKYDVIIYQPEMLEPLQKAGLYLDNNDMRILACAACYDTKYHPDEVVFVTNDMALFTLSNLIFGNDSIEMVGYDQEAEYTGYMEKTLSDDELSYFYSNQSINMYNLNIGQYLIIYDKDHKPIDTAVWTGTTHRRLKYGVFSSRLFGDIKSMRGDIYQACAVDSLLNNQVTMLKGAPGSGKTTLALGYLFSKLEKGQISKIVVFCNTIATRNSAKLGFYPGTRNEKLLDSQIGNLLISKLGSRMEVEALIDSEQLVLLPLSDIRGYETPDNSGVYISEAQNLDIDMMQLALTRIGENSICIIDGDDKTQVDSPAYAGIHNGMKRVSKVFRNTDIYGEIELQYVHRSKVADLARKLT